MKRKIYLLLSVILMTLLSYAQSTDQNYIVTRTYNYNTNNTDSIITIQYFDGLGRPIETVQKGITPQHNDLVTLAEYDGVGREQFLWLPKTNSGNGAFVEPATFKSRQEPLYSGDSRPYTETRYEASPLNRVTEQFGAGQAWGTANKRVTTAYQTNAGEVKYFYVNTLGQLAQGANYAPATLYKTVTADEDGKQTTEYKDKLGQVVMQRRGNTDFADTYYVNNDLGQLSYVLPPLAADAGGSADAINKYGYVYKYDERGNCIYKKLPGCDPIYMAYDKANRMIVSQDGNQRAKTPTSQWMVTKYDVFGRVLYTGTMNSGTAATSTTTWQTLAVNLKNTVVTETYDGSIAFSNTGYTCASYSGLTTITPLTVNYYDNYNFLPANSPLLYTEKQGYSARYTPPSGSWGVTGLLTGNRTYLLDGNGKYTVSAMYYDDKGNVVQTRFTNHLGGYDIVYNDLDFIGKPNKTLKTHSIPDSPAGPEYETGQCWTAVNVSELYTYTYDNAGRLLKTYYQINNKPTVTLADMSIGGYDELGRLILKKRHNTDTESFQYNIRNWPTKITSGTFEENMYYNTKPSNIDQATPIYNGNICYSSWTYNGSARGYQYNYDELNRFTGGYAFINNVMQDGYQYSEWFNYNKMGNITHLNRNTFDDTIDQLNFNYNGNQISSITDAWPGRNQNEIKEYQDINDATVIPEEFIYDKNGNLTTDLDRDIVTIKYNLLNLPDIIQFKNGNQIRNLYDAGGRKLRIEYSVLGTPVVIPIGSIGYPGSPENCSDYIYGTEYMDNFEYGFENDCGNYAMYLDKIYNSEGYAVGLYNNYPNWYSSLNFFYYRKDHLGNNREVWQAPPSGGGGAGFTSQRTQYYPSGLPWAEGEGASVQNKKYNGKEWIEAHGLDEYDSQARMYYPAIMRTTTLDPLAEKYYSISPYAWCGNNPVNRVDLDGRDWLYSNKDEKYTWRDDVTSKSKVPYGYQYVGANNNDILTHMGLSTHYETKTENNVDLGVDGEEGKGGTITGVSTKVKADITISTNVNYKKENIKENNENGRTFEGVSITANVSEQTQSSSDDVVAKSYGYLGVKVGGKEYTSGLGAYTGEVYVDKGKKPTTATVNIPSSTISSSRYLSSATIGIGDPNPNMVYSRPVNFQWNLQTRTMFRKSNKK